MQRPTGLHQEPESCHPSRLHKTGRTEAHSEVHVHWEHSGESTECMEAVGCWKNATAQTLARGM